jgi:hypothetical protein
MGLFRNAWGNGWARRWPAQRSWANGALPGRAQVQKAVKIAYALHFANLADFVSWRSWAECGVLMGDLHKADYRAVAADPPRVFADAADGINLYDDPIT